MSTATFPTTPLASTTPLADTAVPADTAPTTELAHTARPGGATAGSAQPIDAGQRAQQGQPADTAPATASDDTRGLGIASFVLGLVSVVSGWTLFAPLTGLILGIVALRRGTSERTLTLWGVVLNGVMLGLAALALTALLWFVSFGIFTIPFIS